MWRAVYTRTSFDWVDAGEVDPELFAVPMPVGTRAYDDRLKLSFEIGGTYLLLDGTMYEVAEPIMEHPGDKLGEWLRDATPVVPPDESPGPRSGSALTAPAERTGFRLAVSGLIAVGAALLALAVYRGAHRR